MKPNVKLQEINLQTLAIADNIKVLGPISWPMHMSDSFLEAMKNKKKLPTFEYRKILYRDEISGLKKLRDSFTPADPLEQFTYKTIESFIDAAELVEAVGTPRFQEQSIKIFGTPTDKVEGTDISSIQAAELLRATAQKFDHPYIKEPEICISAQMIADELRDRVKNRLKEDSPEILIQDNMAAKASASGTRVNLRNGTCFSRYDSKQLFIHEIMTHSLTAINGRKQIHLATLGRGAPRTTETQEGLATYSEVITGAIDLKRLSRLALRVLAVEKALNGADFVDLFNFFEENGQSPLESYAACTRIFRGGTPQNSVVFTKDAVYLSGLLQISALFKWALTRQKLEVVHMLFCGRLTIEDCFELEPYMRSGILESPKYTPEWYDRIEGLAGRLAFSILALPDLESGFDSYFQNHCKKA